MLRQEHMAERQPIWLNTPATWSRLKGMVMSEMVSGSKPGMKENKGGAVLPTTDNTDRVVTFLVYCLV